VCAEPASFALADEAESVLIWKFVSALSGQTERYIHRHNHSNGSQFTRWGLVQEDINKEIDRHLIGSDAQK